MQEACCSCRLRRRGGGEVLDDGVEKLMTRLTASSSGVSVSSREVLDDGVEKWEVLDDGVEKLMARLTASSSGVSVMSMDPWHRIAGS